MIDTESKREAIAELCRRYHVARLDLFGSATGDDFDPATSDLDFIVGFQPNTDMGPWLKQFFQMRDELCKLFGRDVDLVMEGAIRNPRFARMANQQRTLLYAA